MCVLYTFSKARVVLATTLIYAFCMHNAQASRVYRTTAAVLMLLRKSSSSSWKVYKRNWQNAKQPHLQTFHEKEIEGTTAEKKMHDERKQSCLSKGLPYQKCVFTSRIRQQRQRRIFDFTPLLTRSRCFFQSSQEWLLYESLSTVTTYTEAYHEGCCRRRPPPPSVEKKRQRKKKIMIKTFCYCRPRLRWRGCRRVSVSLRLSLWRMKISRHDTYTTPYYV